MKKLLQILLLCLCANLLLAQRYQIVPSADTLAPLYRKASDPSTQKVYELKISVLLNGTFDTATPANNDIVFEIQNGTLSFSPLFITGINPGANTIAVNIPAADWPATLANAPKLYKLSLFLRIPDVTTKPVSTEVGLVIIQGQPQSFHTLVFSNAAEPVDSKYNPNKPFWVEVGANFDLIDGLRPNNPFFGVFFNKRDIRPLSFRGSPAVQQNKAQNNLGIFAGVFESRTVTVRQTDDFFIRTYFDNSSFISGKPDSIKLYKDAGKYAVKKSVNNIGLFFSPQLRLTAHSANEDGLHVFFSAWIELQWQQIKIQNDFTNLVRVDSQVVGMNKMDSINATTVNSVNSEFDIRSHYFGIGFPIFFREDNVHLFINPVIGFSNQPTSKYFDQLQLNSKLQNATPERKWSPFYAMQFRLNEEKYGISFTGEVRGLLCRDNPPFVSLALSKKFDLKKFLEFR
jgi:hypothetical protein